MNKKCVPEGAFIKCDFADSSDIKKLKVTHNGNVLIYGKKMATEKDKKFLENIPKFDKCKKGKCKFCAIGNWKPLGEKAMIGNSRLLLENSKIKCEKGGTLSLYLTLEEAQATGDLGSFLLFQSNFKSSLGQGMEMSLVPSLALGGLSTLSKSLFQSFDVPEFVYYGKIKIKKSSQGLYLEVIEKGLKNGRIIKVEKNGKNYYVIKDEIYFENYGKIWNGKLIFTALDGEMRIFIVREKEKAIAIPFGAIVNKEGKSPFDYVIENKSIEKNNTFIHYHLRSGNYKNYMTRDEMKRTTEYYANKMNSQNFGETILKFLAKDKEKLDTLKLNEIAGQWSGSSYSYNFGAEIEAHADLLLNKTRLTKFIRSMMNNRNDEQYYNSLGIADLGANDKGKDKVLMDQIWGQKINY